MVNNYKRILANTVLSEKNEVTLFNIVVNPIDLTNEIGDILERISISMSYEDMYGNTVNNYNQGEMS